MLILIKERLHVLAPMLKGVSRKAHFVIGFHFQMLAILETQVISDTNNLSTVQDRKYKPVFR